MFIVINEVHCLHSARLPKDLVKAMKGMKHATSNQSNHSLTLLFAVNKGVEAKLLDLPAAEELKRSTIDAVAHDSPKGQR
ncbi:hypothetical protein SAMN05216404_101333 [Nitrosospira multiformis]|uniref:Uncharacterized protein n=1 Tax=Nitrosospira multiformis TaxID=1231 RepID=A0A1H8BU27_9PROT|nr:hypothetical protein SAMN05216404_101333 [Nitrosospira multiformis]